MYQLDENNIKKAYQEGSSDVKKILETLCPDLLKKETPFPKLMKYTDIGTVVFFTKDRCGYVVSVSRTHKILGDYSESWVMTDRYLIDYEIKD
jgi:hypothetical protein